MEFKVKDLFHLKPFNQATLISGKGGIEQSIKGVTIIEAPDIADWISGGELLLSSLYPMRSFNETEQVNFIKQLAKKEVSALIIKTERFVKNIPDCMVRASEQYHLPIIQIPKDLPYIEIMYPVMQKLFSQQETALKYFREAHDRFIIHSLANEGADKIIATLSELVGNPVAVYDRNFRCMSATNPHIVHFYTLYQEEPPKDNTKTKFDYYHQKVILPELSDDIYDQVVMQVETIQQIKIHLVITEVGKPLTSLDFIAIENAATALSLELVKQYAVAEAERKFEKDLIDDLIMGKIDSLQTAYQRANLIGWDLQKSYAVVLFHLGDFVQRLSLQQQEEAQQPPYGLNNWQNNLLYETIQQFIPNTIIRNRSDEMIVLWNVEEDKNNHLQWLQDIKNIAKNIQITMKKQDPTTSIQVGIGNPAPFILELPKSYKEAQDALQLGQIIQGDSSIVAFSDLGIFRLLCQFEHQEELNRFIPPSLQKLVDYNQPNRDDLLLTLQTFLNHHQNTTKTAQELFVHYKTVIYRIERIKEITGMDFDDSEEMLSVQVGLKILILVQNQ